jgi:hypothetical protein
MIRLQQGFAGGGMGLDDEFAPRVAAGRIVRRVIALAIWRYSPQSFAPQSAIDPPQDRNSRQ